MARIVSILFCFVAVLFISIHQIHAETILKENATYKLSLDTYVRTDVISLNNNLDLDGSGDDDQSTYFGIDYYFGFDLSFADHGPQFYLKLQRSGPYGYDAPLFIHNTLQNSSGQLERYRGEELLPEVREFWADFPVAHYPIRTKAGLYNYSVGHGLAVGTLYENYGVSFYQAPAEDEDPLWRFHYFYPDVINGHPLGPYLPQEKFQGIDFEHNQAQLFILDGRYTTERAAWQPYVSVLYDGSGDKRSNLFATPTREDLLGTAGLSADLTLGSVTLEAEAARNFGEAKSSDDAFEAVQHCGYLLYAGANYTVENIQPHVRYIFASGNEVTPEMINNGDSVFPGGKNRAFSVYSPLNENLFDAVAQPLSFGPLIALGLGWGNNDGIARPTTFGDAGLLDNLVTIGTGVDVQVTDRLSVTFDYWYLRTDEKGVGLFNGEAQSLPAELGHELDVYTSYEVNDRMTVDLTFGYFIPGRYYQEPRDDTDGSLFTPFLRGDGETDNVFQAELSVTIQI